MMRIELDDLAAVARTVERQIDGVDGGLGAGIEVHAAVHEPAVAVVERPVDLVELRLASGDRAQRRCRRGDPRSTPC
jgi:hypothetical protein